MPEIARVITEIFAKKSEELKETANVITPR